mmetsp:Transcript_31004/g.73934  ORF Transcript_31004/g.73934 Transcript_31004/m.73934 type:complete len:288 (-) Transcript_31004:159-1022(-)
MGDLRREGKPVHRVLRTHVVAAELALQGRDDDLVHLDVAAVELERGDAVLAVCLPPDRVRPQIEQFDVSVVESGEDRPFIAVGIAECDRPAITRPRRRVRNEADHRGAHPRVPDLDAPVLAARNDLRRLRAARAPDAVDRVHDAFVRLDRKRRRRRSSVLWPPFASGMPSLVAAAADAPLYVAQRQRPSVFAQGDRISSPAASERRTLDPARPEGEVAERLRHPRLTELVHAEPSLVGRGDASRHDAGRPGRPLAVVRGKAERFARILDHARRIRRVHLLAAPRWQA